MIKINTLPFAQLKNAEHVAFFTNVQIGIEKFGAQEVGLNAAKYKAFTDAVAAEQDIVNRSMASIYTPEMKALDEERDRLFRLIRLKLQSVLYAGKNSPLAQYAATVGGNLLAKYGGEITAAAYQEESALLRGFILDVNALLGTDAIAAIGIGTELNDLEVTNNSFADQYNERVTEKSQTSSELTKRLRDATEELFHLLSLTLEYNANTAPDSDAGSYCVTLVGVVNELMRDARQRLNVRLGHAAEASPEVDPSVTMPEFPEKE